MKVIFLDIDGVLWTVGWSIYAQRGHTTRSRLRELRQWDPIATSNLQHILDHFPEFKIVISSTWRMGRPLAELQRIAKRSGLDEKKIIGVTPIYRDEPRGKEIQDWMTTNNVKPEDILILDDDSDMEHLTHRLILTDSYDGLTFRKVMEIETKLQSEGMTRVTRRSEVTS